MESATWLFMLHGIAFFWKRRKLHGIARFVSSLGFMWFGVLSYQKFDYGDTAYSAIKSLIIRVKKSLIIVIH